MHRSNKHGDSDNKQEWWTLRLLRRLQEHTEVLRKIYEDLRPVGKSFVKGFIYVSGGFAGLSVFEQAVSLLRLM